LGIGVLMLACSQGCAETKQYRNWTCEEMLKADSQALGKNDDAWALGCRIGIQQRNQEQQCEREQSYREAKGLPGLEGPECRKYQYMQEQWREYKNQSVPVLILPLR
jgi:hypothetical protein